MPITTTDIHYRLSGGASNSSPLASLGGAQSSTQRGENIFDDVSSAEAAEGRIEYRCIYVRNNHATLTALAAKIWIQSNTPSPDTTVEIGLGVAAQGGTETAVGAENTAPAGVVFSAPANFAAGLNLGDIPAGGSRAVWEKRTVNPGAAVFADSYTLMVQCDTAP